MGEPKNNRKNYAVILAAGMGTRMMTEEPKQLMKICRHSVLYHSVRAFEDCTDIDGIVVVIRKEDREVILSELSGISKLLALVDGGEFRAESSALGVAAITDEDAIVAIHDAARPLITPEAISEVIRASSLCGAASAASVITDTVKRIDECGFSVGTLPRGELMAAGTPQAFDLKLYRRALEATVLSAAITDDNMLVEQIGISVKMIDVGKENIKITHKEDFAYAEYILTKRGADGV